ncbi:MAG: hypothetical protein IKK63_09195 [Clostridia bacterium]|nr:hypothetical protein [Clostridia bacterium]MBR3818510.1 hypothetical protein [Clostridia bacterium]
MALSDAKLKEYSRKLLSARMNLVISHPFYGALLMHVTLSVDETCDTAYTDTERICFGAEFLDNLSAREVEFVMLHEIMHIVLHHCKRGLGYNQLVFNIACDIVVNSTILESFGDDTSKITLSKYGESIHLVPDGREGRLFSAEEVYSMLMKDKEFSKKAIEIAFSDDHSQWKDENDDSSYDSLNIWNQRVVNAAETATKMAGKANGNLPRFAEALLNREKKRRLDWRTLLREFIEEDISDYSFNPPDRRFSDSGFFLPDFNGDVSGEKVRKILFMIDTSASISEKTIHQAFNEIECALEMFSGGLEGWLGFFDGGVKDPVPFENTDELRNIRPVGGGGTSFREIFRYIRENMKEEPPASIVIFTDGYDKFPEEDAAMGIPVLWVICKTKVTPPWGVTARIE